MKIPSKLLLVAVSCVLAIPAAAPAAEKKVGLKVAIEPAPLARSFEAQGFGPLPAGGADPLAAAPAGGVRLSFGEEPLAVEVRPGEAQVIVLPVPSYRRFLVGEARAQLASHLEHLDHLISGSGRVSGFLDPLPRPAEKLRFRARVEMLGFGGDRALGVIGAMRFVGGYSRHEAGPPTLAYTVQGITSDKRFLVTLYWPVKVVGFAPGPDPSASGFALDALPASAFEPSLEALDTLAKSLRITL